MTVVTGWKHVLSIWKTNDCHLVLDIPDTFKRLPEMFQERVNRALKILFSHHLLPTKSRGVAINEME